MLPPCSPMTILLMLGRSCSTALVSLPFASDFAVICASWLVSSAVSKADSDP